MIGMHKRSSNNFLTLKLFLESEVGLIPTFKTTSYKNYQNHILKVSLPPNVDS